MAYVKLLDMIVCIGLIAVTSSWVGIYFYKYIQPHMIFGSPAYAFSSSLIMAGSIFMAVPLGLILANGVLWGVPQFRKKEEEVWNGVTEGSFKEGNKGLLKVSLWIVPISIASILFGIFQTWVY